LSGQAAFIEKCKCPFEVHRPDEQQKSPTCLFLQKQFGQRSFFGIQPLLTKNFYIEDKLAGNPMDYQAAFPDFIVFPKPKTGVVKISAGVL